VEDAVGNETMKISMSQLKYQRGTSIVEFAFVAPLFFLLLFGIIEFSVILFDKATITNASREAARAGIVFKDGDRTLGGAAMTAETTAVKAVATNYASSYLLSLGGSSSITTSVTRSDSNSNGIFDVGDQLTVDITYPYSFLALPSFVSGIADHSLGATTVMLAE
jgi:Flp pilus assembly protein TadG